jgi:hypothetical protein
LTVIVVFLGWGSPQFCTQLPHRYGVALTGTLKEDFSAHENNSFVAAAAVPAIID